MSGKSRPSPTSVPAPAVRSVPSDPGAATIGPVPREHPLADAALQFLRTRTRSDTALARSEFFAPAYHAALGLVYRRAVECRFEKFPDRQQVAAERASTFLPEIERRLREVRSKDKPCGEPSEPPKFTQPYIAAALRSFTPSIARLSALAKAVALPPSCIALMGETLLNLFDGRYPATETDAGPDSEAVIEFFRTDEVMRASKELYTSFRDVLRARVIERTQGARDVLAQKTFSPWLVDAGDTLPAYGTFAEGLGGAVREWRKKLHLSQPELAKMLNAAASKNAGTAISQVENFRHSPSWPKMFAFVKLYKLPPSELFFEAERQAVSLAVPVESVIEQAKTILAGLAPEDRWKVEEFIRAHERGKPGK